MAHVDDREGIPVVGHVPQSSFAQEQDNHSSRFRRSYVAHYLSAQAEWMNPDPTARRGQPIMWIRGETFPDRVHEMRVLPVEEYLEP